MENGTGEAKGRYSQVFMALFLCVVLGILSLAAAGGSFPPATQPPPCVPPPMAPAVTLTTGGTVLENQHFRLELATSSGLALAHLMNKHMGADLTPGHPSALFAVWTGGRLVDSRAWSVRARQVDDVAGGTRLTLHLVCEDLQLAARLSALVDSSPELTWSLSLTRRPENGNEGQPALPVRVYFPLLQGLTLGEPGDTYYFFPCVGGWCSNEAFDLGVQYGEGPGSLQVMAVFNPRLGGGLYTYVRDQTGGPKVMLLRKVDDPAAGLPGYVPLHDPDSGREPARPPAVFTKEKGCHLGVCTVPVQLGAGQTLNLPPVTVAVHAGDWHQALRSYSDWAHTWWHPPDVPRWIKGCFNFAYAHDEDAVRTGKYIARPEIPPSYHMMQWSKWWKHSDLDKAGQDPKPDRWYGDNMGDYEYEDRWGGVEALRQEVKRYQQAGSRMVFYLQSYLIWKHSRIAQEHWPEWAAMWPDGTFNEDYSEPNSPMNCYGMCVRCQAWQDYLIATAARVMHDTGADGIYLDSLNFAPCCVNPRHEHIGEHAPAVERLLRLARQAIRRENPQAILWVEFPCSDYLLQFVDMTWLETFAGNVPVYARFDGNYGLHFLRFYFPEIKYAEWNPDVGKLELQRRNFFNGIGTSAVSDYLARTGQVMRENLDAFASAHPEPLIPTAQEGVFANHFPTTEKSVFTVWNRTQRQVSGPVLQLPHREGYHYVELLAARKVTVWGEGGQDVVALDIGPDEVLCVAQLPTLMSVRGEGEIYRVRVAGELPGAEVRACVVGQGDTAGSPVELRGGEALIARPREVDAAEPVVVKLLAGGELQDAVLLE